MSFILSASVVWTGSLIIYWLCLRHRSNPVHLRWYLLGTLVLGLLWYFIPRWSASIPVLFESVFMHYYLDLHVTLSPQGKSIHWAVLSARVVYVFIVILLFVRLILSIFKTRQIGQLSHYTTKNLPVYIHNLGLGAFSFLGRIYIPHHMDEASKPTIIHHEQYHVVCHHSIDILFIRLMKCFLWFHPLLWTYERCIRDEHEKAADLHTLQYSELNQYIHLLKFRAFNKVHALPVHPFNSPSLSKRLIFMKNAMKQQFDARPFLLIIPLIALLFTLTKCDHDDTSSIESIETSDMENIHSEAYKTVRDNVYKVADQKPRFPGCENITGSLVEKEQCATMRMLEFLYDNIKYPTKAKNEGIEGQAVIQFVVHKDGHISDAKIVRDVAGGCGEEALRVVNLMNEMSEKWTPGRRDGQPVNVIFNLPIKFKMQ